MSLSTPVALLIFNRPSLTKVVFGEISKVKPKKLLVIADGPRAGIPGEEEKCATARAIVDEVDWDCQVLRNYSDMNLGCGLRPATGITWVFEHVEKAIILEDDCVPHTTFFRFCSELLEKYRNDERVMMITGTNVLGKWKSDVQSYHFSNYGGALGWASWRRAWKFFDYDMELWKYEEVRKRIRDVLADEEQFKYRADIFDMTYRKKGVTWWDYQWGFARLLQSGLSIVPSLNLVSNIGFTKEATHTVNPLDCFANLPWYQMPFPLRDPPGVTPDREYDRQFFLRASGRLQNRAPNIAGRASNRIRNLLRSHGHIQSRA